MIRDVYKTNKSMLIKQKETKAKYDQLRKCQSGERIKKENI